MLVLFWAPSRKCITIILKAITHFLKFGNSTSKKSLINCIHALHKFGNPGYRHKSQVLVVEGLRAGFRRRRFVGGLGLERMRIATVVGTYKPYPTKFHLHLGEFVHIPTRIWWVHDLHGNSH
jgi:hypothetical protein